MTCALGPKTDIHSSEVKSRALLTVRWLKRTKLSAHSASKINDFIMQMCK